MLVVDELVATLDDLPARARHLVEAEGTTVTVTTPALNSRLGSLTSDSDAAVSRAHERLEAVLAELHGVGVEADGVVGDEDPLLAIADLLRTRTIDEMVIVVHSATEKNWREGGITEKARERFGLPVTEVIVRKRRRPPTSSPAVE